jgi:hypothetical protein
MHPYFAHIWKLQAIDEFPFRFPADLPECRGSLSLCAPVQAPYLQACALRQVKAEFVLFKFVMPFPIPPH